MKKNYLLIFLLALIGWSSGMRAKTAAELNTELQALIPQSYTPGQSFTIQTTKYLKETGNFMVLKSGTESPVKLYNQINKYIGLTNDGNPNGWKTSEVQVDATEKTNTWNLSSTDERKGWFSWKANKTASQEQDFNGNGGAKIVIKYDAESQKTTIELSTVDGWTDIVNIEGLELNAREISFTQGDPNDKTSSVTFFAVGEPKQVTYKIWDATNAEQATSTNLLGSFTVNEVTNNLPRGISQISSLGYVTIHNQRELPTVVTEETTNEINLYTTATLPFVVSTQENTMWYSMKINNNEVWLWAASENSDVVGRTTTKFTAANQEQYMWSFEGDWYHGFSIKNLKTKTYIGTAYGTANSGGASKENAASLGEAAKYEYTPGANSAWRLKVNNTYLAQNSSSHPNVGYWDVSNYDGSKLSITPIYTITIKTQTAEGTQVGEGTYTYYVESGTTTIAAPKISGYATNQKTISITANQNQTVTVTYEEAEFDVIARMDDFVTNGTVTATLVETTANVEHGAVYDFKSGYISGAALPQVAAAYAGDDWVTVAMWVYGNPSETGDQDGALFGYGNASTGIMMKLNNGKVGLTTKNVKDVFNVKSSTINNLEAHQWNLVAYTYPGSAFTGTKEARCYVGGEADYCARTTDVGNPMAVPGQSDQKCAIGSGNYGNLREGSTAMIANVTVFTSSKLPTNAEIYSVIGAAPVLKNDPAIEFYRSTYEAACDKNEAGNDTRKPFTAKSDVLKPLFDALSQEGGFTPVNVAAFKAALADPNSYYPLPNGRYFVHNYYKYDKAGTPEAQEENLYRNQSTLASLTALVGTAGKVAGYWSVWDITHNAENNTYIMRNEGNQFVMTPGSTNNYTNMSTDGGYLYYNEGDESRTKYQVGNADEDRKKKDLKFTPAVSLYDASFNGVSLADRKGYVTISGSWNVEGKTDCAMYMDGEENGGAHVNAKLGDHRNNNLNSGDNIIKSGRWADAKDECLWSFYRIDSNEGNSQEQMLFFDATDGSLSGCVGGVLTLDNVENTPCLKALRDKINDNLGKIASKELSMTEFGKRALAYKDILTDIEKIRTKEEYAQFYQKLTPNATNPFYIENISAERPSLYSRLVAVSPTKNDQGEDVWPVTVNAQGNPTTDSYYWQTLPNEQVNHLTPEGEFYVNYAAGYNDQSEDPTFMIHVGKENGENAKYIATTDRSGFAQQTRNTSNAAQFKLQMVIPTIYQLKQTNNQYFLVSGTSEKNALKAIDEPEISALWRIITYNTVNVKAENPVDNTDFQAPGWTAENNAKPVFTTFSCELGSRVENSQNIVPYILTSVTTKKFWKIPGDNKRYPYKEDTEDHGKPEGAMENPINRVYIQMEALETIYKDGKTCYYMEANEGYLLVGSDQERTLNGNTVSGITPEDIELLGYVVDADNVPGYQTVHGKDLFSATVGTEIPITLNNMNDYFALTYTTDVVGQWNGQPVYGEGLGFYRLAPSKKIGKNKAYIALNLIKDSENLWEDYDPNGTGSKGNSDMPGSKEEKAGVKSFLETGDGFGICLKDNKGNVTSIIEIDGKGKSEQQFIYDLQGRRVEKAGKGIYIVGGRKVLFN